MYSMDAITGHLDYLVAGVAQMVFEAPDNGGVTPSHLQMNVKRILELTSPTEL